MRSSKERKSRTQAHLQTSLAALQSVVNIPVFWALLLCRASELERIALTLACRFGAVAVLWRCSWFSQSTARIIIWRQKEDQRRVRRVRRFRPSGLVLLKRLTQSLPHSAPTPRCGLPQETGLMLSKVV